MLMAIIVGPLSIGLPYAIDSIFPGTWQALQAHPEDDSLELEFVVRLFLIGFIPAFFVPRKFYLWPFISIMTLGLAAVLISAIQGKALPLDLRSFVLLTLFALPLLAVAMLGALVAFGIVSAKNRWLRNTAKR